MALACMASSIAFHASAQTTGTLRETVVTSSRTATQLDEQLSDITLITRSQIDRSGATSLTELLNTIAGVQVRLDGIRGAIPSIFIRGTNTNHALMLVDGQRVSSATVGSSAFQHLPLDQIDRVEVLRGPASSLYGADALGGVIQVFTREGQGAPAPSLSVGAGSLGSSSLSVGYGGQVGDTRFHAQVGADHTRGMSDVAASKPGTYDSYNPDRDGYRQQHLGLKVSQRVSADLEIGANYLYTSSVKHTDVANCDNGFPSNCTTLFDNHDDQVLESGSVHARWQLSPTWTSSLRLGWSKDDLQSLLYDPTTLVVSQPRYRTHQDQLAWQNEFTLGPGKLMAALEWRGVRLATTQALVSDSQTTRSAVLGYQAWIGSHLLQTSLRRDDVSGMQGQTTGSLGYGYRLTPGLVARGAIGNAFHAPTFNDLYWPLDPVNFYVGNPNLRPEKSTNRELGLTWEEGGRSASLTVYRNKVRDLIAYYFDNTTFLGTMNNIGSATLSGASLGYRVRSGSWNWGGSYDYLSTRDDANDHALAGRMPRTLRLDIGRDSGAWSTSVRVQANSRFFNDSNNTQSLAGYGLLGLQTSYRVNAEWSLRASLQNLLNRQYVAVRSTLSPFNDYSTPGRTLFVGLRYAAAH